MCTKTQNATGRYNGSYSAVGSTLIHMIVVYRFPVRCRLACRPSLMMQWSILEMVLYVWTCILFLRVLAFNTEGLIGSHFVCVCVCSSGKNICPLPLKALLPRSRTHELAVAPDNKKSVCVWSPLRRSSEPDWEHITSLWWCASWSLAGAWPRGMSTKNVQYPTTHVASLWLLQKFCRKNPLTI